MKEFGKEKATLILYRQVMYLCRTKKVNTDVRICVAGWHGSSHSFSCTSTQAGV